MILKKQELHNPWSSDKTFTTIINHANTIFTKYQLDKTCLYVSLDPLNLLIFILRVLMSYSPISSVLQYIRLTYSKYLHCRIFLCYIHFALHILNTETFAVLQILSSLYFFFHPFWQSLKSINLIYKNIYTEF